MDYNTSMWNQMGNEWWVSLIYYNICSRTSREMQIIEIFLRGMGQYASLLHLNIFSENILEHF